MEFNENLLYAKLVKKYIPSGCGKKGFEDVH